MHRPQGQHSGSHTCYGTEKVREGANNTSGREYAGDSEKEENSGGVAAALDNLTQPTVA